MSKVSFIGLGRMGFPMAGHLAGAGHEVTVFNRTTARAKEWTAAHAGLTGATIKDAVRQSEMVFMCVGDDPDIEAVALQAFDAMERDSVLVDHTTGSAKLASALSVKAKERGLHFVDAPVSGGEAGAQKGQLTIMCGGDAHAYFRAEPVMRIYAKMVKLLGPSGSGQKAKMVNQICIAGVVQGLSEAIHFAEKSGLNPIDVVEVISKGAAQSWQMENRSVTMHERVFDFGFAVEWMRKDLRIALSEARACGAQLPLTALIDQFYAEVEAKGGKRWDTSSLITRLSK